MASRTVSTMRRTVQARIRQRFPFFSGLFSRRPSVRFVLRACDVPGRIMYREMRRLPPNDLRVRVGVDGRLFGNEVLYLTKAFREWLYLLSEGMVRFDSNIVEIGCGCGRRAHVMRDYRFHGQRYRGRYVGIDIDRELLDWCRQNFDPQRFEFHQSTHKSQAYVNDVAATGRYTFPVADGSTDLVFSTSVLTHLLEDEVVNYFEEAFRVLRDGGYMTMSCRCIDLPGADTGGTYMHRIGNAYVESPAIPEAAVAYESTFLLSKAKEVGFVDVAMLHSPGNRQQTMVARRPELDHPKAIR